VLRPGGQVWIYDLRFALRRAETAARGAFPSAGLQREPVRTGWFPVRLGSRLVAGPA
jgi:hypothetical protein